MNEPRFVIPEEYGCLLSPDFKDTRYFGFYGGRASTKSHSIARAIIARCMTGNERVFCGRETLRSIDGSVHQLLQDIINQHGLAQDFRILRDTIICKRTDSTIVYGGLKEHVVDSQKSLEGVTLGFFEESSAISQKSIDTMDPTIRAEGSQIIFAWNPDLETDAVHQMLVIDPVPNSYVQKVSWRDNQWFTEDLRTMKNTMRSRDHDKYLWIWEGNCRTNSESQILANKYVVEDFEPDPNTWAGPYGGLDHGFSQDPLAAVKMWIHDETLFVEYEAGGIGIEIDEIPKALSEIPEFDEFTVYADSARPETNSWLNKKGGFGLIKPCDKWKGSVEDGISYLRSFKKIVFHPRCKECIQEAKLYSYKVDKMSGDITTKIVDADNHYMDAMRYGLNAFITRSNVPATTSTPASFY